VKGLGSAQWKLNLEQPGHREENGLQKPSILSPTSPTPSTCGLDHARTQISQMEWKEPTDNTWVSGEVEKKRREAGSGLF